MKIAPLLRVNPFWLFDESSPIDDNAYKKDLNSSTHLTTQQTIINYEMEKITDEEKILLRGYRAANPEVRSVMSMIAEKAIHDKDITTKRKA